MVINVQLYRTIKRRLAQGLLPYPLPIEAFPMRCERRYLVLPTNLASVTSLAIMCVLGAQPHVLSSCVVAFDCAFPSRSTSRIRGSPKSLYTRG